MMRVKLEKAVFTMTLFRGYSLEWFNNFHVKSCEHVLCKHNLF